MNHSINSDMLYITTGEGFVNKNKMRLNKAIMRINWIQRPLPSLIFLNGCKLLASKRILHLFMWMQPLITRIIGHHRVVASHYRLLPGASTPIFAEGSWQDHSALSGLVSQIRILFSNFPEASLHFLPRQFNMDAHGLAKEAIRSREEV
ncbi:hypothetical protein G4B88_003615 [Cannabis sativa]|uniref:RNase H type-1 domain-containing protein n=1 Tax=Cannabis sativa TaxID=3483 RepID=A0A7J6FDG6_CANSA|nr:hypothetical protein G4B88_003615 [Cannabis sativa]